MPRNNDLKNLFFFLVFLLGFGFVYGHLHAQPSAQDVYPLTLEENDFPPAAPVIGSPTVFQTAAATRNRFVIVVRNGLMQRRCGVTAGPCDYTASGNVTVTYAAGVIQAGDLVTVFFYR